MPAEWLIPAIGGALGLFGGVSNNRNNLKIAREQMRFQERMSSTAFQRSRADLEAAGYNPVMAFDRPASSPSGASTQFEDPVGKGISTGIQAKQMMASLEVMRQDAALKNAQRVAATSQAANAQADTALKAQQHQITGLMQPHVVQLKQIEALAAQLGITEKRAMQEYWSLMGPYGKIVGDLSGPAAVLGGGAAAAFGLRKAAGGLLSSGKSASKLFRAPNRRAGAWETFSRKNPQLIRRKP